MVFVSVTRLRLRSVRFLPFFAVYTTRSLNQVKKAAGFRGGSVLPDQSWTFWTMTTWDSQETMRQFMLAGAHRAAMAHLMDWCDEASVVHWEQAEDALPHWNEADQRMRKSGRTSKVRFPSAAHSSLSYRPPRIRSTGKIQPARA